MKRFFILVGLLVTIMVIATCGQSKSNYRVSWDADATGKTASWNVYLEQRATQSGFILQPGTNRYNTDLTQPIFTRFENIVATTTEVIVQLNNDGQWLVAGVEAMSGSGVYSDLGLNTTPYQKGEAPPVPGGVTIERLPD